ncbi:mercury resistance system periplasmic binding protein MerP [Halothiobacillus sp.]|uniref:mercury resistance system periplasmic binding protein MerP n=1 Tax=Halothiobacillus sp. TaxID=1891311 RepID=UPI002AD45083|nr:mercury resistance system periplasmic binding protein MerP [Halothiobacillus sp.]
MKKILAVLLLTFVSLPTWAATQTVTLSVPGMYCAVCPITVKKALTAVKGVTKVKVDLDFREASVSYDDAKTNVAALIKATTDAGYPSEVQK